jgi:hypothetical protein
MIGSGGTETATRAKGPPFRPSLVTLVVGVLIAVPGLVVMGVAFWHLVFATTYDVPGTARVHLHEGRYIVYENTATSRSYGVVTITNSHGVSIDASEVSVTATDGTDVAVYDTAPTQSMSRNSDHYESAVEFEAPRAGDYTVRFDTATKTRVVIEPPLGELFTRRVGWLVVTGIGWLVVIVGAAMLIIGSTRRGRVERAAIRASTPSPLPSARWSADPLGQHRLRYWDGSRWTDHVAD